MRLVIEPSRKELGVFVSKYVVARLGEWCEATKGTNAVFSLCLSGRGKVMSTVFEELVHAYRRGQLSFKRVAVFSTDEFVTDNRFAPWSQHAYFWHKLFKHVDILRENVHILNGAATDLSAECRAFEEAIEKNGGLDLVVTESGRSGEVGRNVPGASLVGKTSKKLLPYDVAYEIAEELFDGDLDMVPRSCLSVGVGTVLQATEVVVLFSGIHKALSLEHCVEHPVNHMWPVSALQKHRRCLMVCDEAATLELRMGTVKYFQGLQETAELLSVDSENHRRQLLRLESDVYRPQQRLL